MKGMLCAAILAHVVCGGGVPGTRCWLRLHHEGEEGLPVVLLWGTHHVDRGGGTTRARPIGYAAHGRMVLRRMDAGAAHRARALPRALASAMHA